MTPTPALSVRGEIEKALQGKWGYLPVAGPWHGCFDGVYEGDSRDTHCRIASSCGTRGKTEAEEVNNLYIAAACPDNIRALLAGHDAHTASLEAELARLKDALEEIALAGMSPSPEMSENGVEAWHARQAWRFISIAARAISPPAATTQTIGETK